eukprot:g1623.t1
MITKANYTLGALCISLLPVCLFFSVFVRHESFIPSNNRSASSLKLPFNCNNTSEVAKNSTTPAAWQAGPVIRDYEPLGVEFTDEPWWEQRDSNRTLYVATECGTGNVLEIMASALTVSYRENINIKFVFIREKFGPATWDDLFSFPKLNFNYTFPDGVYDHHRTKACTVFKDLNDWKRDSYRIKWSMESDGIGEFGCVKCDWWKEPPFAQNSVWFYRILRPTKYLQLRVDAFKKSQEWNKYQWVGVHIRRTDNLGIMKWLLEEIVPKSLNKKIDTTNADEILPLDHYITTMRNFKENYPVHNLDRFQIVKPLKFFLATDRDDIKSQIIEVFPEDQVIHYEHGIPSSQLRSENRGMKLAVIDMFLLASCQVLIGTPFSTFSEAAHYIGGNVFLEPNFAYQKQSK